MKKTDDTPVKKPGEKCVTNVLAERFNVEPQTPRASLCRYGHWNGLVPVKLPNGRLMWDVEQADRLLAGEVVK